MIFTAAAAVEPQSASPTCRHAWPGNWAPPSGEQAKCFYTLIHCSVAEPEPPYLGRLRSRPIWSVRAEREPAPVLGFFRIAKRKSLVHAKYDFKKFFFVHNLFQSSNWQIFVFTETEPPGEPPFFCLEPEPPKKVAVPQHCIIYYIYYITYILLCDVM